MYYNRGMENEPSPFPEMRITPRLKDMGEFLLRTISFLPNIPLARGDHRFEKNTGAAPLLDEVLYSE